MSDIDRLVGPRGRSGFLARAAQHELKRERLRTALEAARGAMVGTPGWRTADEIIKFVDGLRSEDRDPWADQAGEGARSLADALIAATAWNLGATLVTRNPRDFERLGIPVMRYA